MKPKTAIKQLQILSKNVKLMRLAAEDWKNDYEILISTILSARTRDEITIPAAEKLFRKYNNAYKLSKAKITDIENIIRPVNFYKTKAKNIINCAKILVHNYNGGIPHDINELLKLPGVGRKTANVFLAEVGYDNIGIDTHVAYISRYLRWTRNSNPYEIEADLKELFPKRLLGQVNATLVRFGKTYTSRKQKDKILGEIKKIK